MDEQDGDELNVLPSPGTTRDGLQRAGRRAQRYVKCFYQQFFFVFNRKKKGWKGYIGVSNEADMTVWRTRVAEVTARWRGREWQGGGWGRGGYLSKIKKCSNGRGKKKKKQRGERSLNPGWGWTCHRVGFFGCRRQSCRFPTGWRAVTPPAPPALSLHCRDTLSREKTNAITTKTPVAGRNYLHFMTLHLCFEPKPFSESTWYQNIRTMLDQSEAFAENKMPCIITLAFWLPFSLSNIVII